MFYDNFLRICKEHGISPSRAAEACGINRSNVSNWKANGYTPRSDVLNKIADYFGVSVDYLLGNEQKKEPTTKSDELDLQLEGIDFALFGEVKEMTDEQKQDVLDYIKFKKSQQKRE